MRCRRERLEKVRRREGYKERSTIIVDEEVTILVIQCARDDVRRGGREGDEDMDGEGR